MKKALLGLVMLASMAMADTQESEDLTAKEVFLSIGDLLVVRPLGAAATVGGFGIFAVASPFAAMAGAVDEVWDPLVQKPAGFTFFRDLGDFSGE